MAKVSRLMRISQLSVVLAVLFVLPYITINATTSDDAYPRLAARSYPSDVNVMKDEQARAIISGNEWLSRYAGRIYDDAKDLNFQLIGIYGRSDSPRCIFQMIDCYHGIEYVHTFPTKIVSDSGARAALLNINIPPKITTDELISAAHSLVSCDMHIESNLSAEELRERLYTSPVDNSLPRNITHRGIYLRLRDYPHLTKLSVNRVMDRIFKFISGNAGDRDQPTPPPDEYPRNTIKLFNCSASSSDKPPSSQYSQLDLDSPARYAVYESIIRKSQITDVTLSGIYRLFNKGTKYEGVDPYSIGGSPSLPVLNNATAVFKAGSNVYNPLNMTLYISGDLSIRDILGDVNSLPVMVLKHAKGHRDNTTSGLDKRRKEDSSRQKNIYENTTKSHVPDVSETYILPKYILGNSKNFAPQCTESDVAVVRDEGHDPVPSHAADDRPQKEYTNSIPSISVLYTLDARFVNKSLLHGPILKYVVESIFGLGCINDTLLADINEQSKLDILIDQAATNPIIIEERIFVTVNYEFDYPLLIFTFYDITYTYNGDHKKDLHAVARNLMGLVRRVLKSSSTKMSKFWNTIHCLDECPSYDGKPGNYLQDLLKKSYFLEVDGTEETEYRILKDIANLRSMGLVVMDDIFDKFAEIVNDIVDETGGSIFKYLNGLFTNNNSSNSIIVSEYGSKEINEELLGNMKVGG